MNKVKKAVIPAAGRGTRFLPASKAVPKELFPLVDKPVIQCIVEEAAAAGIEEALIVTGARKEAIARHFARDPLLEAALRRDNKTEVLETIERLGRTVKLRFAVQHQPLGLGHAVWCARDFAGHEPFAVLLGDMVCEPGSDIGSLLEVYREKQAPVIAVQPVEWSEVGKYGIVKGKSAGERLVAVEELVEKPKSEPPSNLAIMGRYVLEPDVFPILARQKTGAGGEIQLTDALQELARRRRVYALSFEGNIRDAGDKLGYLQAVVGEALRHPDLKGPFADFLRQAAALAQDPQGRESS
ncbi:UTP--glucose-1-phosphate uridylyltransferase [Cohnella caldifontis]|uniref:UTP--glucose-1-phosphate uridylyltransferase n=1 Tax=Cohnella caldifontis TaxID=3027471 RepID=UPI0023EC9119|nr:UTP--glucose-1-phosphate uridylyltransferase [Cohnella sp. YIM B05605]